MADLKEVFAELAKLKQTVADRDAVKADRAKAIAAAVAGPNEQIAVLQAEIEKLKSGQVIKDSDLDDVLTEIRELTIAVTD